MEDLMIPTNIASSFRGYSASTFAIDKVYIRFKKDKVKKFEHMNPYQIDLLHGSSMYLRGFLR